MTLMRSSENWNRLAIPLRTDRMLTIVTPFERRKQVLSMDEFDKFNQEDLEIVFEREAYLRERRDGRF